MNKTKMIVIGLDCASPHLIFNLWKNRLPTLSRLVENSLYGTLRSSIPPITVPAWMCMATGKNPGTLGLYGFRERKTSSYTESAIADSTYIKERTVWDILGEHNLKTIVLGVPPTYPVRKVNGILISDFLTPSLSSDYTYPKELKTEIKQAVGDYIFDTKFRIEDREKVLEEILIMTRKRFELARYLLKNKPWDFFMMVEIGVDRIHHAFWKFFDKTHTKYVPNHKFKNTIFDYYKLIDDEIGLILKLVPEDTIIMIVSDHGVKKMKGVYCINEYLINKGYLALKKYPAQVSALEEVDIEWPKTRAFAWGGYYARIFLNVKGRDPQGAIDQKNYYPVRDSLITELENIKDDNGKKLKNIILPPEKIYPSIKGNPADIFAFFDNLSWRAAGSVGHKTFWIFDNDTGPDDAVHDWEGIFILHDPRNPQELNKKHMEIYDVAPTILNKFHLNLPSDMEGEIINYG